MIDDGETVCIIGASGAGKSTTLRAISPNYRRVPSRILRTAALSNRITSM